MTNDAVQSTFYRCRKCSRRFESLTPQSRCHQCDDLRHRHMIALCFGLGLVALTLLVGWLTSRWLRRF